MRCYLQEQDSGYMRPVAGIGEKGLIEDIDHFKIV